jgi:hypothetical protein
MSMMRSGLNHDMLDRTTQRFGQFRTIPESHHEIGPTGDMSRIAPYGGNLDGLIDEGMSQVQGRRLKAKR